jgi:hypothetical protein
MFQCAAACIEAASASSSTPTIARSRSCIVRHSAAGSLYRELNNVVHEDGTLDLSPVTQDPIWFKSQPGRNYVFVLAVYGAGGSCSSDGPLRSARRTPRIGEGHQDPRRSAPDPTTPIAARSAVDLLERSLERCGIGRSVLADRNGILIAGNKATEQIADLTGGEVEIITVRTNGRQLVVVQREDLDLLDPADGRARELAIADNRVAEVDLDWDANVLLNHMPGVDVGGYFFDQEARAAVRRGGRQQTRRPGRQHEAHGGRQSGRRTRRRGRGHARPGRRRPNHLPRVWASLLR